MFSHQGSYLWESTVLAEDSTSPSWSGRGDSDPRPLDGPHRGGVLVTPGIGLCLFLSAGARSRRGWERDGVNMAPTGSSGFPRIRWSRAPLSSPHNCVGPVRCSSQLWGQRGLQRREGHYVSLWDRSLLGAAPQRHPEGPSGGAMPPRPNSVLRRSLFQPLGQSCPCRPAIAHPRSRASQ